MNKRLTKFTMTLCKMYVQKPRTLEKLKRNIHDEIEAIRQVMFQRVMVIFIVVMTPLEAADKLFFIVFGQKQNSSDLMVRAPGPYPYRPDWTAYLFKIVLGVYLMVTIVVLGKLLIATMSDTYHQMQGQSYTAWKFGLSKLIRRMEQTTTDPTPINLITTWLFYFTDVCKARVRKSQRASPRTKAGARWFARIRKRASIAVSTLTQLGHSVDIPIKAIPKFLTIERAANWKLIANKYRLLTGRIQKVADLKDANNDDRSSEESDDSYILFDFTR